MTQYISDSDVEQHVLRIVAEARDVYGIAVSLSGQEACQLVGLKLAAVPMSALQDGLYVEDERLVLYNDRIRWQPRIEYTIFHEIMHHLIIEDGELYGHLHDMHHRNHADFKAVIERCCEMGAAEFMMPREEVRESIKATGFCVELVEKVSEQFGASLVASAIQVAVCAPVSCYVVLCDYGWVEATYPQRRCLFVDYAARPDRNKYPMPRYLPIESDHLIYEAWRNRTVMKDQTYVPRRKGRKDWKCSGEAKYLDGRVVGLLLLEEPKTHSKDQMTLPL